MNYSFAQHDFIKLKARDKLRGDNILKYFPEWTPYFKDEVLWKYYIE